MDKWADYCVSKILFDDEGEYIKEAFIYKDLGDSIGEGEVRNRNWMVTKTNQGYTFCTIKKTEDGKWRKLRDMIYETNLYSWGVTIPRQIEKRKVFVSFYNKDNCYRESFDKLFDDIFISKSVDKGDIASDNADDYVKHLIQNDYLADTSVLVILIGPSTKCRKHVDWEIYGSLDHKVGDHHAGFLGLKLPSHQDFGTGQHTYDLLPKRLSENLKSHYAIIRDWTTDRVQMQEYVEIAFSNRTNDYLIKNRSISQMQRNTCE